MKTRWEVYYSVIDGLDAYIGGSNAKYVYDMVSSITGFDFTAKSPAEPSGINAYTLIMGVAPIYYVEDIAAAYRAVVEDYDKFNDALVSAVADVKTLVATDMATYSKKVASFNGAAFVAGGSKTRLAALQAWLVDAAMDAFEEEYESVAKRGIDEVIARSLKDAVKTVADFVEDFEGQADVSVSAGNEIFDTGNVVIEESTNLTEVETVLSEETTINLSEGTVLSATNRTGSTAAESSILTFAADGVIKGDGTIENPIDYGVTLKAEDATLKIEGGNFIANCTAINVVLGTVEISGGFFEDVSEYDGQYLINCTDANFAAGKANVVITGGTFVNWNPAAATSESPVADFVAAGYEVKTEVHGADTWYIVEKTATNP